MNRRTFLGTTLILPLLGKMVSAAEVPAPRPNEGLILFYRPRRAAGSAIRFFVTSNGVQLGNLANGTAMAHRVKPGQHSFQVSTPSVDGNDNVTVNVKSGQTVFIRGDIRMGWPAGRGKFTVMSETQGRSEVSAM